MLLAQNTVVAGRFRLNYQIGQGGMGSVWHATHLGLDIPCAVKFIDTATAQMAVAQARFEREAKAAAQLRSPHVVQVLDHGIFEGTPYIAMELLEGEDVGQRLTRRGGRLAPAELFHILHQVCRALTKAHAVGIVHRDLKPDNIFLVRDDDREIAKVLDFGIAKQRIAELKGASTRTGAILGTPYYMSPEQAQGTKTVDARSDLWSLAVIAFQAITGQLPFQSDALGDLLIKIIVSDLPVPSQCGPTPPGFDQWWLRAACRDPRGRFQTAKEFSDSLAIVCQVSQVSGALDRASLSDVTTTQALTGASAAHTPHPHSPSLQGGELPIARGIGPAGTTMTPAPTANTFAREDVGKKHGAAAMTGAAIVVGFVALAAVAAAVFLVVHRPEPSRGSVASSSASAGRLETSPVASDTATPASQPPPVAATAPARPAPATAPASSGGPVVTAPSPAASATSAPHPPSASSRPISPTHAPPRSTAAADMGF